MIPAFHATPRVGGGRAARPTETESTVTSRTNIQALTTGAALAGLTAAVLRRMEQQYSHRDTLAPGTVAAMYGLYGSHAAALGWACRRRVWPLPLPPRPARALGGAMAATGVAAALAGVRTFSSTAQLSGTAPEALHTTGVYRYSRNPQYLGLQLAAAGAALASRSGFAALLTAQTWSAYRRWIPSEEAHLLRVFGAPYRRYIRRTGRFLPGMGRRAPSS